MIELLEQYKEFNNILNPEDKAIYFLKAPGLRKNEIVDKIPIFYKLNEISNYLVEETIYNLGIDLSQTNYIFVDCDNEEDAFTILEYLKLNNIKYIQTSSMQPNRFHLYFKKPNNLKIGKLSNFKNTTIHDYYAGGRLAPYAPVIPSVQNGRKFLRIEEPDYLPEFFR